jgi:hypothetical protein
MLAAGFRESVSPVVVSPVLRRLLPAFAVSAIGDGMSAVAVAWLAIRISSPAGRGLAVGVAVAAYTLPGAVGAVLLSRPLRRLSGRHLVAADAALRAVTLGVIPLLYASGGLRTWSYVGLLAASSLLHAWGVSGQYTLVAEHLPPAARTTANALLSGFSMAAYVIGPLAAGLLVAAAGPALPVTADADYLLYGPVEVALPLYVTGPLRGSAGLLGLFWAVFGIGATVGSLITGLGPAACRFGRS